MTTAHRFRASFCLLAALFPLLGEPPARAGEPPAGDLDTATLLFRHGKALVDAGRYAEACPEFEAAKRLVAGIGVTLYLGDCYEQTGRTVRAWEQFENAREAAEAKRDDRARVARERADRLWPRLSKMTLVVPPSADVAGLVVTADGSTVDRGTYNVERPIEPGTHRFRATAPSRTAWETSIEVIATPASLRVEVPLLAEIETSPPARVPPPPGGALQPEAPRPAHGPPGEERSAPVPTQRIAGLAILGTGVLGLTAGAVFGLQAKSRMDDSNASGHCQANDHCDSVGLAERSDALTKATLSTIAFAGGLTCAAAGAVLYLTTRDRPRSVSLTAGPQRGGGSVLLEGRW